MTDEDQTQDPEPSSGPQEPRTAGTEPVSDSAHDVEPRGKRGCSGLVLGLLLFPFRAYPGLVRERKAGRTGVWLFAGLLILWLYLWATPVVMWACHTFPEPSRASVRAAAPHSDVEGVAYVDALIYCYEEGMSHWMVNDRIAPTIFLDNPQNFQLGVREGLLYGTRVLRDNLSRLRSTDAIDEDVRLAHEKFSFDPDSWIIPQTESQYRKGVKHLRSYRQRLIDGSAKFHPRADNLAELLQQFNSVTGGANVRLTNCIPDSSPRISEETLGDPTLSGEEVLRTTTPWLQVDDEFFYARGVAFVYREIMVAINHDFRELLEQRNAQELSHSIVVDFLDKSQFTPWPIVTNGSLESPVPNHPYKLLGILSQVREKSRSLHTMVAIDVR